MHGTVDRLSDGDEFVTEEDLLMTLGRSRREGQWGRPAAFSAKASRCAALSIIASIKAVIGPAPSHWKRHLRRTCRPSPCLGLRSQGVVVGRAADGHSAQLGAFGLATERALAGGFDPSQKALRLVHQRMAREAAIWLR